MAAEPLPLLKSLSYLASMAAAGAISSLLLSRCSQMFCGRADAIASASSDAYFHISHIGPHSRPGGRDARRAVGSHDIDVLAVGNTSILTASYFWMLYRMITVTNRRRDSCREQSSEYGETMKPVALADWRMAVCTIEDLLFQRRIIDTNVVHRGGGQVNWQLTHFGLSVPRECL
eukprot:6214531-Pleurochrysis_carterae.AAC.3